jgi:hypothetical protein
MKETFTFQVKVKVEYPDKSHRGLAIKYAREVMRAGAGIHDGEVSANTGKATLVKS